MENADSLLITLIKKRILAKISTFNLILYNKNIVKNKLMLLSNVAVSQILKCHNSKMTNFQNFKISESKSHVCDVSVLTRVDLSYE